MKKLRMINKVGYGVGDLANGLTFGMSSAFLLAFYTDVLGITAAAAGLLFLVARIWDAINDPMMGGFADKMFARRLRKHRAEGRKADKFRRYLLTGSWPVVVFAILMFVAPSGLSGTQKLVWAYATYIAWGMAYTFINIPYGSLAAVMTQDPVERSTLSVFRGLGGLLGVIMLQLVVPLLLGAFSENEARGYLVAMVLLGAVTLASYIFSYLTVEENIEHKIEASASGSFKGSFSVVLKNRPFVAVSIASVAMLMGLLIQSSMSVYFFKNNIGNIKLMGLTALTTLVPMLVAAVLVPILVKKFGTKKTASVASLISAFLFLILLVLPTTVWIYLTFVLVGGIFLMIPHLMVWGMVSDCIDYNHYLSGVRQEGVIYGLYSFVRKMGQAFAGFFAGMGLTLIGYDALLESQTVETLMGIKFLTIGFPAICMLVSWAAIQFIWNLTPEKQAEVTAHIGGTDEANQS